jgi:protein-S-isoprenylcysteine O-methyltransferase Ste14
MTKVEHVFVWSGGALFVLSLAACVYAYVFVWASPAADAFAWTPVAINAVLFAVFAFHHSLFARKSIKQLVARIVPDRLVRSFYVWIASLLLLIVLAYWQPIAGEAYAVTGWRALAHAAVQVCGLWLIARSVATIDPLELAGIRPPAGSDALQIAGPYRFVRHPVYLGWVLAVFGAAQMTGDRLVFAAITTAYLCVAIPWEERSLLQMFGEPYARYRRTVRWRIIPYVYQVLLIAEGLTLFVGFGRW